MTRTGELVASAVFIAFGITLPIAFHFFGGIGSVFLPMHIPVLIAGLFLGRNAGLLVGFITPILSSFLTGMPPIMPILPIMIVELAFYGAASGYLYKGLKLNLLTALIISMVIGRTAAAVTVYFLAILLHIKLAPIAYITGAIVTGLPGILIQIIAVPVLVNRLQWAMQYSAEKIGVLNNAK